MKHEYFNLPGLRIGGRYSKVDVSSVGKVEPPANSRDWTGIIQFSNCVLFFVTLEKGEGREDYAYNDYFEGDRFSWESQNRQTEASPVIRAVIDGSLEPHLFVRIHDKVGNVTQPFVYCGRLQYLAHAGANPVAFWFSCPGYVADAKSALAEVYSWSPRRKKLSRPVDQQLAGATSSARSRGQSRQLDPERRKKVELHAMKRATAHYVGRGYEVVDTSSTQPFDLLCKKGVNTRRVEVKGTIGDGSVVTLTAGEVRAARKDGVPTDLFILMQVALVEDGAEIRCEGGRARVLRDWVPADADLEATEYRYSVAEQMQ